METFIRKYKANEIKYELPCKHLREAQGIQTAILISLSQEDDEMVDESKENKGNNNTYGA